MSIMCMHPGCIIPHLTYPETLLHAMCSRLFTDYKNMMVGKDILYQRPSITYANKTVFPGLIEQSFSFGSGMGGVDCGASTKP